MDGRRPLTDAQQRVLDAIRDAITANGMPPMLHEIGAAVGLTKGTVCTHVQALTRKGYLIHRPDTTRALQLIASDGEQVPTAPRLVQVLAEDAIPRIDVPPEPPPVCTRHPRTADNRWIVAGIERCRACGRAALADHLARKAGAR